MPTKNKKNGDGHSETKTKVSEVLQNLDAETLHLFTLKL